MAIQKSIEDDFGATHSDAYTKVEAILLRSNDVETELHISVYHNIASRSKSDPSASKPPFISSMVNITESDGAAYFADGVLDDNGKSPLKQAYAYIKAQDDFLGQNWTTGTTDV